MRRQPPVSSAGVTQAALGKRALRACAGSPEGANSMDRAQEIDVYWIYRTATT
jgi:hypothetical protein